MDEKWILRKEELNRLINIDKISYEEIGRMYNCSGTNIKRVAKLLEIPLPIKNLVNSKRIPANKDTGKRHYCLNCGKEFKHKHNSYNKYCSVQCAAEAKAKECYKSVVDGDSSIMRGDYSVTRNVYKFIIEEQHHRCAICGMLDNWQKKPLKFIVDHIDGDASNNTRKNLRCICPNCDSQLPTYKNKGGRKSSRTYRLVRKQDRDSLKKPH